MEFFKLHYPVTAASLFIGFIVAAHLAANHGYRFFTHTMSDLSAQRYPRKRIMQIGFVLFGGVLAAGTISNGVTWRTALILIYGVSMVAVGVFCVKPFFPTDTHRVWESKLHVVFSIIAGAAFGIGIFMQFLLSSDRFAGLVHIGFLVPVIGLSIAYSVLKNYKGIAQKSMYVVGLVWIIGVFTP